MSGSDDQVEYLTPSAVPAPKGHYSPAAAWRDLVFVSGQLPDRDEEGRAPGLFAEQVRSALAKMLLILRESGSGATDILKITAYIVGVENWGEFNTVYAEVMGEARPARAVVPVPELHYGCLVEVEAVAVRRG